MHILFFRIKNVINKKNLYHKYTQLISVKFKQNFINFSAFTEIFLQEFPYIYTNLNSDFEWTSGETTTEGTKTTPMKTAPTTKETTTTLTTTSEVPPEKCDHVCLEPEVDDWVIAVMCVLAVAVLCQSFIIYVLSRSKIKAKSMYKEKL